MEQWRSKSVKDLQRYLKDRGVTFNNELKVGLIELCEKAALLDIEVDPDGLDEDRGSILAEKLHVDGVDLVAPALLQTFTDNIAILPLLSIFDLYNYLTSFQDHSIAKFRDFTKMEGYTMAKDGFVLKIEFGHYSDNTNFVAVKSQVKPRTKDRDSITKLRHYNVWIIMSKSEGARVHSAYCTCKGG